MSQENVEVVRRVIAALNSRDIDGYIACCAKDFRLQTPLFGGEYEGSVGIRRFFADLRDTAPEFHVTIERLEAVGADRVLAIVRLAASGRTSGIETPVDSSNVYDLVDGKIARTRVFRDRAEALKAVGLEE